MKYGRLTAGSWLEQNLATSGIFVEHLIEKSKQEVSRRKLI
jgi:hypothetical protein